jgi:serine protease AprX
MKLIRCISTLSLSLALVAILLGFQLGPVRQSLSLAHSNAQRSKVSAYLLNRINSSNNQSVSVIIQTRPNQNANVISAVGRAGGTVRRTFSNLNLIVIDVPSRAISGLASRNDIDFITFDNTTEVMGHLETAVGADQARDYGEESGNEVTGQGVGIAIIDSGVDSSHHAFRSGSATSRVTAAVDFTDEGRTDDPYGHGTHVAAIAAGNAHISRGAYTGIAPAATIINVRVLNTQGRGLVSNAIAGIDWCITNKQAYNIQVLNLSFGTPALDSYENDPLCLAVRRAVDAGLVVCAAAGNLGKDLDGNSIYGTINSPGDEPSAITVGASNTKGTDVRSDDVVTTYSSRGPTRGCYVDEDGIRHYDNLIKPDLVAPGNKLIQAQSPGNHLVTGSPDLDASTNSNPSHAMMYLSGSSMATPAVSGAAAMLLQRNPGLTPNLVKAVLEYTAQPLAGFDSLEQGAGSLNVEGAVRLAGLIRQDLSGLTLGEPLLTGEPPEQTTTIAGETFAWSGTLVQKWNVIGGSELIILYQGIYGTNVMLSDGVMVSEKVLLSDGGVLTEKVLLSDADLLSDNVLLSNGVTFSDGTAFLGGTLVLSGTILSDKVLLSDGTVISDKVLLSDSLLISLISSAELSSLAQSILRTGEGACMLPVQDSPEP